MRKTTAIILGAGKSTRMGSDLPKVLHALCGKPLLFYALDACRKAGSGQVNVVVGFQKGRVTEAFAGDSDITWVDQTEQLGTGHAVMACQEVLESFEGDVLVIAGDMPLVRAETLTELLRVHRSENAVVSLATARLDDPAGYGRIIRDDRGRLSRIIEHDNCNDEQKRINEVNISYYCFDCQALFEALRRLQPDSGKGEYYITDVIQILIADGGRSAILPDVSPEDGLGVNTPQDLVQVETLMQRRISNLQAI